MKRWDYSFFLILDEMRDICGMGLVYRNILEKDRLWEVNIYLLNICIL